MRLDMFASKNMHVLYNNSQLVLEMGRDAFGTTSKIVSCSETYSEQLSEK
jgi:hypothetical protein